MTIWCISHVQNYKTSKKQDTHLSHMNNALNWHLSCKVKKKKDSWKPSIYGLTKSRPWAQSLDHDCITHDHTHLDHCAVVYLINYYMLYLHQCTFNFYFSEISLNLNVFLLEMHVYKTVNCIRYSMIAMSVRSCGTLLVRSSDCDKSWHRHSP